MPATMSCRSAHAGNRCREAPHSLFQLPYKRLQVCSRKGVTNFHPRWPCAAAARRRHAADRGLRGRGCGLLVRSGRSGATGRSSAAECASRAALQDVPAGDPADAPTCLPLHPACHSTPLIFFTAPRVRRSSARRRTSSRGFSAMLRLAALPSSHSGCSPSPLALRRG